MDEIIKEIHRFANRYGSEFKIDLLQSGDYISCTSSYANGEFTRGYTYLSYLLESNISSLTGAYTSVASHSSSWRCYCIKDKESFLKFLKSHTGEPVKLIDYKFKTLYIQELW